MDGPLRPLPIYLLYISEWKMASCWGRVCYTLTEIVTILKRYIVTLCTCGLIFVRLQIFKGFKSIPGLFGIWIISRLGWVKPQISHEFKLLKVEVNELDYNEQTSNPLIQAEIMTLFQNFLICCKF